MTTRFSNEVVVGTFDLTFDTADGVQTLALAGDEASRVSVECVSANAGSITFELGLDGTAAGTPSFTPSTSGGTQEHWMERGRFFSISAPSVNRRSVGVARITSLKLLTDAVAGSDITLRVTFYRQPSLQ